MDDRVSRGLALLRYVVLMGLWGAFLVLMLRDYYVHDPPDPSLTGTDAYGHNSEGVLRHLIPLMVAELLIVVAILRPRTYVRAWGRALAALVLAGLWTLVSMFGAMHAGGAVMVHLGWMMALSVGLVLVLAWSVIAAARD